jgi:hypothetical protein
MLTSNIYLTTRPRMSGALLLLPLHAIVARPGQLPFLISRVVPVGAKRDEVTGEWRKLHNEELNDLYSLPNYVRVVKSRIMRWAGHLARMGEGRGVHRVLVGKPEGRRTLGRPRLRWEDNIKRYLQEVGGVSVSGFLPRSVADRYPL